jgi:hypothetical protein
MLKIVYAVAAAAIIAGCLVLSPSLSPQVAAGTPAAGGKSDRADLRPLAMECSQRAWPYYEASCLRDTRNRLTPPKEVRFVSMEKQKRPAGRAAGPTAGLSAVAQR